MEVEVQGKRTKFKADFKAKVALDGFRRDQQHLLVILVR
jgi:sugar lactone lactonase YvrE